MCFWNIYGSGLAGEFNIFQVDSMATVTMTTRSSMDSVTSCCTSKANDILVTGDTLGYLKVVLNI